MKQLVEILKTSRSETLIAPAGTVTPGNIAELSSTLKQTIWVVESTSRQMDWTQDSSNKSTALWHEIIESNQEQQSSDLPSTEKDYQPLDIVSVTPLPTSGSYEITTYTQKVYYSLLSRCWAAHHDLSNLTSCTRTSSLPHLPNSPYLVPIAYPLPIHFFHFFHSPILSPSHSLSQPSSVAAPLRSQQALHITSTIVQPSPRLSLQP